MKGGFRSGAGCQCVQFRVLNRMGGPACPKSDFFFWHPSVSIKDRAIAKFFLGSRQEKREKAKEIAISGFPAANR